MNTIFLRINNYYLAARQNKWFHYFAIFCRVTLAIAFFISGIVKINGERFAAGLASNHPLGHYFDALHITGYYYTFIGWVQLITAILLLIPRTALLAAMIYFPIIVNICVLTYALRFEGTRAATFMLLANLYLLCWDYNKIKYIFSTNDKVETDDTTIKPLSKKSTLLFFAGVITTLASVVIINHYMYDIRPGNSVQECTNGCPGNTNPKACAAFCDCIYVHGEPLDSCLVKYKTAVGR